MAHTPDNDDLMTVTFKYHSVLNEAKSKEAGRPIFDDKEVCEMKSAANRQTTWVFPAHQDAPGLVEDPRTGMKTTQTYAQKYNAQYLAFKNGDAQAQNGTPLNLVPGIGQGKVKELNALNIYTAEALSMVGGTARKMLGMEGDELIAKAKKYLEEATGPAAAEIQAKANAELREQMERMQAELNQLRGGEKAEAPGNEDSPFASFDDDDIRNWLGDAGVEVDRRWGRKTLIEKAEAKNAALKKQELEDAA